MNYTNHEKKNQFLHLPCRNAIPVEKKMLWSRKSIKNSNFWVPETPALNLIIWFIILINLISKCKNVVRIKSLKSGKW